MSDLKDWIAPKRTALLLVDMQVDFASPEGAMARQGKDMAAPRAAVRNANLLTELAREAGVLCVFTRLIARRGEESEALRTWKARRGHAQDALLCREGTKGAEFVGPRPLSDEPVFSKALYNPFVGTGLNTYLRAKKRDTLVIAGLTTECCIDSTARSGFHRDYHIFIASDAVAAYEPELHRAALRSLELSCAILAPTKDIRQAWKRP